MKVSEQDAKLFFELMWPLQYFVNQRMNILADISSLESYVTCSANDKYKVRTVLFKDKTLIDAFVRENPQGFSSDHLAIISNWKTALQGIFISNVF